MKKGNRALLYGIFTLFVLFIGFLAGVRVDQKIKTHYIEQGKQMMVQEIVYETIFTRKEFHVETEVLGKKYYATFVPRLDDKKVNVRIKRR